MIRVPQGGLRGRGFAALPVLLALAVVVTTGAIAAALISGQDQLAQREQQQAAIERIEQALLGFVLREARLPCPDTSNNGEENCPSSSSPQQRAGAVPYRTLGLNGQLALGLTYAAHMGDNPRTNLTDASGQPNSPADVVRIELPLEIPDLGSFSLVEDRPAPDIAASEEDREAMFALLQAQNAYDDFLSRLITNAPPAVNVNGGLVGNSLTAFSGNYINALTAALSPPLTVPINNLSFSPGAPAYEDLLDALSDLVIYQRSLAGKGRIFRDEFELQVLSARLAEVVANANMGEAQQVSELEALVVQWQGIVNAHNLAVSTTNGSFSVGNSALNSRISANPARPTLSSVPASPTGTGSGSFEERRDAFETLLVNSRNLVSQNFRRLTKAVEDSDAVSTSGGAAFPDPADFDPETADPDDFDPENFDGGDITSTNRIDALLVDYSARKDDVEIRISQLKEEIGNLDAEIEALRNQLEACRADDECNNESALEAQIASRIQTRNNRQQQLQTYEQLKVRYETLVERLGFLNDDLFCRAVNDGVCVVDSVEQAYLDRIEEASEALTGGAIDREQTPVPEPDPENDDLTDQETADFTAPSQSITLSAADYPTLVNLADFCFKLDTMMMRTGEPFSARLGYASGSGSRAAAFVLVEHGNNQRLDAPNQFGSNVSAFIFAAPDRPHGLLYDDRVRPMTPERLSIMMGCPALLQSFESFANTAEEINLLFLVAKDALDSAQQDVITSGITLALAIIRLAVDTAAVIKDTAGGTVATAKCVASLGFAVNFCVAAGFKFSAAAAHGFTLVADAAAVALAGVELDTAIRDRASARETLTETTEHYRTVVQAILDADSRGGARDATQSSNP